ncbi:PqqD family protein [Runella aurantiaca]|uniref:PqqD family protein n=1 Tax=Runella aurantiaca TaxID=2282308 RepID=A0A369IE00_9BACT|nr:PqqD family protein [Runella aurantiaca]RDB06637.1 PqqD family protein [Runella aurantiaca]
MNFDANQTFKLSPRQVSSSLDNETIILNHDAGIYYDLNEVGTFIWEQLQQKPSTLAELKNAILEEFEVEEATCENDIKMLLTQLMDEKLVETL